MTDTRSLSNSGLKVLQSWRHAVAGDTRWSLHDMCIGWSPEDGYRASFMSANYYLLTDGSIMHTVGERTVFRVYASGLTADVLSERFMKFREPPAPSSDLDLLDPDQVLRGRKPVSTGSGIRDARVFWRPEGWHWTARIDGAGIGVGRVDRHSLKILMASDGGSRDWVPVAYGGAEGFDMLVGVNRVLREGKVVRVAKVPKDLAAWRLGPPLVPLDDGTFLGAIRLGERESVRVWSPSRMSWVDGVQRRYRHRFIRVDAEGVLREMSEDFVLEDGGVEKLCGLAHDGYGFLLSWGRNDVSSVLGRIEEQKVLGLLRSV